MFEFVKLAYRSQRWAGVERGGDNQVLPLEFAIHMDGHIVELQAFKGIS